jgi:hypothetical protein
VRLALGGLAHGEIADLRHEFYQPQTYPAPAVS